MTRIQLKISLFFLFILCINDFSSGNTEDTDVQFHDSLDLQNSSEILSHRKGGQIESKNRMGVPVKQRHCTSPTGTHTCVINVKTLDLRHPLILDPNEPTEFIYPNWNGFIIMNQGDSIFLSCTILNNEFRNFPNIQYGRFKCVCEDIFEDELRNRHRFSDLICIKTPRYDVREFGLINMYRKYIIGFSVDLDIFLPLIEVYKEKSSETTVYTKSKISKFLAGGQDTNARIPYDPKYCCIDNINEIDLAFNYDRQEESFRNQFSPGEYAHDYHELFQLGSDFIFTRCYLSHRNSMVYSAASLATYARPNVSPQWKIINDRNWARIEDHVALMATELRRDLIVFTGKYGYSTFLKSEGIDFKYPVALYFYKIVIDPISKKGVVYVTLNKPHRHSENLENIICADQITSLEGVMMPHDWKPNDQLSGYSFMCYVPDFLRNTCIVIDDPILSSIHHLLSIPEVLPV